MEKTLIWLDDIRDPEVEFPEMCETYNVMWVKSVDEFVDTVLQFDIPDIVSFDHDLGDNVPDGYDAAKFLVGYCDHFKQPLPEYYCHSANPAGKANILSYLNSYKKSLENG